MTKRRAGRTLRRLGGALTPRFPLRRPLAFVALAAVTGCAAASVSGRPVAPARFAAPLQRFDSVSLNWAGYVATGASFTHVAATWVEPRVACRGDHALDASSFWIGLGGSSYRSAGLEQTGTSADCVHGRASYYAWYEILPAPATNVAVPVTPGDTVSATVDVVDGVASFTLQNLTTGARFDTRQPVRFPAVDSAEWIAEAPSVCGAGASNCRTLPLARFGSVLFSSATTTGDGHNGSILDAGWSTDAVRLAAPKAPVSAAPSVLSPAGSAFSVATHGPRTRVLVPGLEAAAPQRLLQPQTR